MTTTESQEITTKPYATLDEKIQLFQENGIEVLKHYSGGETDVQVIFIPGELETLRTSIKLATEHNIRITIVSLSQYYDADNEPKRDMYYELVF